MKKTALLLLISLLFFTACDPYDGERPVDQDGTIWISETPMKIYFEVNQNIEQWNTGSFEIDGENIEIKLTFALGSLVLIEDPNKYIYTESGEFIRKNALLFKGNCEFTKAKLIITVSESEIESVKSGDKITFNRVDELPEWAERLLNPE